MKTRTLLLTLLVIGSIPRLAFSQWHWVHPQPQGHNLNDVIFLEDNTAIAVGDVGTIMVTHDQGNTWSLSWKVDGFTYNLNSIDRLDDNSAVAVGDNGIVMVTHNQGASWLAASQSAYDLVDVSFGDALHGIAVGNIETYDVIATFTGDGGLTWQSTPLERTVRSVDMVSATEAYAVGDPYEYNLIHTIDGGATWSPSNGPSGLGSHFYAVDFLDAQHGAIATRYSNADFPYYRPATCYTTSDGGATWASSLLNPLDTLLDIVYEPRELLYSAPGFIEVAAKVQCCVRTAFDPPATGQLGVSTDTGATFTNQSDGRAMFGLARNSTGVMLIVGENGRMLRRSAAGVITNIGGPAPAQAQDLFGYTGSSSFFNSQVGVVLHNDGYTWEVGANTTYFSVTSDGGQSWIHPAVDNALCNDVVCLSAAEMIAVGSYGPIGAVVRSTNGGATWVKIGGLTPPKTLAAVAAGSSTHAVAVAYSDGKAIVIDNGVVSVIPTGGTGFSDVAFASPSVVLAVGTVDKHSTDGGLTWSSTAGPSTAITALDFLNPFVAYGVSPTGITFSYDLGDNWFPSPFGAVSGLTDISFADSQHGMAIGEHILVTNNGGSTWGEIEPPTTYPLTHVTMLSGDLAFVSGHQSILFRYGESPVPTLIRAMDAAAVPFGAKLRWDVVPDNSLSGFSITRSSGGVRVTIASDLAVSTRSFSDKDLTPGKTYEYQLVAVDRDGSYTQSMPVKVTIPEASVELLPNQPNPFNPVTTIRFVVPEKMRVTISIHDVAGRLVATLSDDVQEPGVHEQTWNATGVASGVYFARMHAGKADVSRKMVLLK